MAKALITGFQRIVHRVRPVPVGSRLRVTRYRHFSAAGTCSNGSLLPASPGHDRGTALPGLGARRPVAGDGLLMLKPLQGHASDGGGRCWAMTRSVLVAKVIPGRLAAGDDWLFCAGQFAFRVSRRAVGGGGYLMVSGIFSSSTSRVTVSTDRQLPSTGRCARRGLWRRSAAPGRVAPTSRWRLIGHHALALGAGRRLRNVLR